jgi:SAM-dependent methyltransferase
MEEEFWNKRYSEPGYVYGKEPNEYFKQEIDKLTPGKLLIPGDGEGRNSVYAAKKGWNVTAIDLSVKAKEKALILAEENNVNIEYLVSPVENFLFPANKYDAIALIFVHFPSDTREKMHKSIIKSLKKGGVIIIEAFSKSQIKNNSGGPKDIASLYCREYLENDFAEFTIDILSENKIQLEEGLYHKGIADVIRFKATLI